MPAKDNDPKAPKASAQSSAKRTVKDPATAPTKARAKVKADAAVNADASMASAAPKRNRSVRRPANVAAATEASSASVVPQLESAAPSERPADDGISRESEVRLRAYLIYAERGFRGGSPESDWLQAEREVSYGRQA